MMMWYDISGSRRFPFARRENNCHLSLLLRRREPLARIAQQVRAYVLYTSGRWFKPISGHAVSVGYELVA